MSKNNATTPQGKNVRMDPDHPFNFKCYRGVSCFTECCQDVTIALTPYDVLRLKRGLGIRSDEFIDKYTINLSRKKQIIPFVILKMNEDDKKCPFVNKEEGCSVYEDRPWPCRMFPLDMNEDGTFKYITDDSKCHGLKEKEMQSIGEWLVDQGIVPYDDMINQFSEITTPLRVQEINIENPDIANMVFMALYNLDRFREFIFQSSFLDRFEIEPTRIERIKRDDVDLLKFAFDWIKFGVFGQKLFKVKEKPKD